MKKIVFIIILKIFFQLPGFAQNHVVNRLLIPKKASFFLLKETTPSGAGYVFCKKIFLCQAETATLLSFNDQALFRHRMPVKKSLSVFTELSFSDVLEDSINSLKDGLVNTYDDHITELFSDAPSLFKIKFIIRL